MKFQSLMPVEQLADNAAVLFGLLPRPWNMFAMFFNGLPEMPITGLVIKDCSFSLSDNPSAAIEDSEMYEGLPEITSRAVRLRNVDAEIKNVSFTGTDEAFLIEEGCRIR